MCIKLCKKQEEPLPPPNLSCYVAALARTDALQHGGVPIPTGKGETADQQGVGNDLKDRPKLWPQTLHGPLKEHGDSFVITTNV